MRLFRFALWPAGAALGILSEQAYFDWGDARHWVPDLITGWSLIACGLVGWSRRPQSRSGALTAATGFAWFAPNFATTGVNVLDWLSTFTPVVAKLGANQAKPVAAVSAPDRLWGRRDHPTSPHAIRLQPVMRSGTQ